jgi:hypothetical protein
MPASVTATLTTAERIANQHLRCPAGVDPVMGVFPTLAADRLLLSDCCALRYRGMTAVVKAA